MAKYGLKTLCALLVLLLAGCAGAVPTAVAPTAAPNVSNAPSQNQSPPLQTALPRGTILGNGSKQIGNLTVRVVQPGRDACARPEYPGGARSG